MTSPQRQASAPGAGGGTELLLSVRSSRELTEDLVAEVGPHTRVADLAAALAAGRAGSALRSSRLGRVLDPDALVTAEDVLNGDELHVVAADHGSVLTGPHAQPVAELTVVGGPQVGLRRGLGQGSHVIGRGEGHCDVWLDDPSLSRRHVNLEVSHGRVLVSDAGSRNGTTVEGEPLAEGEVRSLASHEVLGIGMTRLTVAAAAPRPGGSASRADGTLRFNRPPRVTPPATSFEVTLEAPPSRAQKPRLPLAASLLPLLFGVVFAVIVKQAAMLLFAALSPMLLLSTYVSDRRGGRQSYASGARAFRERLAVLDHEAATALAAEVDARRAAAPDAAEMRRRALQRSTNLWERRRGDDDFLRLRVGSADQPSEARIALAAGGSPELRDEFDRTLAPYAMARAVPTAVPLGSSVTGIAGVAAEVAGIGRWLVAQAAILHSPRDVVVTAALAAHHRDAWDWLKWLPHVNSQASPLEGDHLVAGTMDARAMLKQLAVVVVQRREEIGERVGGTSRATLPHILVLLDEDLGLDRGAVGELLQDGPALGVTAIWLGSEVGDLPGECTHIIELGSLSQLKLVDVASGTAMERVLGETMTVEVAEELARTLAPLRDTASAGRADVPRAVDLLELLRLTTLDAAAIGALWDAPDDGLAAAVGVGEDGMVRVALRRDGPHGLVVGTTGSGKSELLQSLVASLAAHHGPDRLSFLLVDYKGGAAFKDCARLPHTVGMVTDLDAHLTERALISLNAELRRREAVLHAAGAKDLPDMERRDPGGAPASLVIVIDEFATLAREVPAFVDGVLDVAQRGRSLGVHVILATQRPGGVVSESIRANMNLRVALRVASPSDSDDVISSPLAAKISRSLPGRALIRTGHSELTMFQSAYVGGRSGGGGEPVSGAVALRPFTLGLPALTLQRVAHAPDAPSDLERLADALTAITAARGLSRPPSPWLPELPDVLPWTEVDGESADPDPGRAVLGLLDEPTRQRQTPLRLDLEQDGHLLVYGGSGAGKTALLRTLAVTLAHGGSPEQVRIFGLDCATRGLKALEALPHCGGIVMGEDEERVDRLLTMLRREVGRRKLLMSESGAYSWQDLTQRNPRSGARLVLLLDSYAGFVSLYERVDGGLLLDSLPRLVADGRSVGIHLVISADRRSAVPPTIANVIPRKLVLRMGSEDEYAALGIDVGSVRDARLPAGRGFTDQSVEFQIALVGVDRSADAQNAELDRVVAELAKRHPGWRTGEVAVLPERLDAADVDPVLLPMVACVGIDGEDLEPVLVDLGETHFMVAGPYRSGRSTALAALAIGLRRSTPGVRLHLLAPRRSPLVHLPLWDSVAHGIDACVTEAASLAAGLDEKDAGPLVAVIDDAAELADSPAAPALEELVRRGRDAGARVVLGIEVQAARTAYVPWIREVRKDGHGVLLDPDVDLDGDALGVRLPRRANRRYPAGRGYYVEAGVARLIQVPVGDW